MILNTELRYDGALEQKKLGQLAILKEKSIRSHALSPFLII